MKTKNIFAATKLAALCLSACMSISLAHAQDGNDTKLRELERAMRGSAPTEIGTAPKSKPRTRAIVFDDEPQSAQESPAKSSQSMATANLDCASLPADVQGTGVDFAINFNVGSAVVAPSSEHMLSQIAKVLSLNTKSCIIVEGHTDASGNFDRNMSLSRERAQSVTRYLSDHSAIDRSRLVPQGKGSSDLLKNLDARDPKNRRVVFKVVNG